MKRLLTLLALLAALALPLSAAPKKSATPSPDKPAVEKPAPDFSGRYERVGDTKSVFILHIRQIGANADLEFSASRADGSGAAPDGSGAGALNDKGELDFTFEDSFGNKGTATFKKVGGSFQLTMKALTVNEPRAVKFYGLVSLKRMKDREN